MKKIIMIIIPLILFSCIKNNKSIIENKSMFLQIKLEIENTYNDLNLTNEKYENDLTIQLLKKTTCYDIKNAKKIIELNEGEIVAVGNIDSLWIDSDYIKIMKTKIIINNYIVEVGIPIENIDIEKFLLKNEIDYKIIDNIAYRIVNKKKYAINDAIIYTNNGFDKKYSYFDINPRIVKTLVFEKSAAYIFSGDGSLYKLFFYPGKNLSEEISITDDGNYLFYDHGYYDRRGIDIYSFPEMEVIGKIGYFGLPNRVIKKGNNLYYTTISGSIINFGYASTDQYYHDICCYNIVTGHQIVLIAHDNLTSYYLEGLNDNKITATVRYVDKVEDWAFLKDEKRRTIFFNLE